MDRPLWLLAIIYSSFETSSLRGAFYDLALSSSFRYASGFAGQVFSSLWGIRLLVHQAGSRWLPEVRLVTEIVTSYWP